MPGGADLAGDLARYLKVRWLTTVFDVGANVGQTTTRFRRWFPTAHVHAFEPGTWAHEQCLVRHARDDHVTVNRLALSDRAGSGFVTRQVGPMASELNKLADEGDPVEIVTGDGYCAEHHIEHIDLLKIDAEGHDVKVLSGFGWMLGRQQIDLVQVEAGFKRRDFHVPLERFIDVMDAFAYDLFRIYDQSGDSGAVGLVYANAVFVRRDGKLKSAMLDRPPR